MPVLERGLCPIVGLLMLIRVSIKNDLRLFITIISTLSGYTALTPFWKSQSAFWASTQVTNVNALQYTYPELQGIDTTDQQAFQNAIAQQVNKLYGPGSAPMSKRSLINEGGGGGDINTVERPHTTSRAKRHHKLASRSNRLSQMLAGLLGGHGGQYSDWTARVLFDRTEVGRSFSVIFFFGSVPGDSTMWLTCPQFVGAHHAFVHSTQCTKCDQDKPMEEGFVSLSPAIADKTNSENFLSALIVPLLTNQLQWRVLSVSRLNLFWIQQYN